MICKYNISPQGKNNQRNWDIKGELTSIQTHWLNKWVKEWDLQENILKWDLNEFSV